MRYRDPGNMSNMYREYDTETLDVYHTCVSSGEVCYTYIYIVIKKAGMRVLNVYKEYDAESEEVCKNV